MATPADGHAGEGAKIPVSSMHDFKSQSDDECGSEDSFGSDYETDEEILTTHADIEPNSLPPAYPDEEYPQSVPIPTKTDQDFPLGLKKSTELPSNTMFSGPSMCVVCKVSPAYSKGRVSYPTCGLTCASKMQNLKVPITSTNEFPPEAPPQYSSIEPSLAFENKMSHSMKHGSVNDTGPHRPRGSAGQIEMCAVCHIRPQAQRAGKIYPTCGFTCDAVLTNNQSSNGNVPKSSLPLVASLRRLVFGSDHSPAALQQPSWVYGPDSHEQLGPHGHSKSPRGVTRSTSPSGRHLPTHVQRCVICWVKPCRDARYVTCGINCAETLCKRANSDSNICDYCHRRPKIPGHNQCSNTCRDNASIACLLCRCRPKFGRYPLCGRTCKMIATKWTPLILEARPGHTIYDEVEKRFKRAWNGVGCPPIKKIYKIIENKSFLLPYDRYKKRVGNEVFRYHGTSRACTLGSPGNTQLCSSTICALCSILRTSFKVSLANQYGSFGAGIYTSSAANKAYNYSRGSSGAMLLTKVVLGNVYNATGWGQVKSCPSGHNSVIFDRQNGELNETIVYTDDAIRPVFLIIF